VFPAIPDNVVSRVKGIAPPVNANRGDNTSVLSTMFSSIPRRGAPNSEPETSVRFNRAARIDWRSSLPGQTASPTTQWYWDLRPGQFLKLNLAFAYRIFPYKATQGNLVITPDAMFRTSIRSVGTGNDLTAPFESWHAFTTWGTGEHGHVDGQPAEESQVGGTVSMNRIIRLPTSATPRTYAQLVADNAGFYVRMAINRNLSAGNDSGLWIDNLYYHVEVCQGPLLEAGPNPGSQLPIFFRDES
jgi:hypothetical protein